MTIATEAPDEDDKMAKQEASTDAARPTAEAVEQEVNSSEEAPAEESARREDWQGVSAVIECSVWKLNGSCFTLQAPMQEQVQWIKEQIRSEWGIPKNEQKLVCGTSVCQDNAVLGNVMTSVGQTSHLNLACIRTSPFGFKRELGHPDLKVSEEGDGIRHGGWGRYQAGFLSVVLDTAGHYKTQVQFSSVGAGAWSMVFVGVAKDANRNWHYMNGAYIAYSSGPPKMGGFYIDDFEDVRRGWVKVDAITKFFNEHQAHRTVDFTVSMDMPNRRLACSTLDGTELGSLTFDVQDPIRLVANVSSPGHGMRIVG